jgi:hypothetical protein
VRRRTCLENLAHNGLAGRGHFARVSPSFDAASGGLCALHAGAPTNVLAFMTIRYLSLLGVLVRLLRAQKPKTEFDVVSVKPSAPDRYNSFAIRNAPGGRVQLPHFE